MTKNKFLKFLSAFDLTHKRIENLLDFMEGDYSFDKLFKIDLGKIVGKENAETIRKNATETFLDGYLYNLENKNIILITIEEELYPEKLHRLENPPYYLFCKGDLSLLNRKAIAIVGSRSPSNYGKIITERFAKELSEAGVVIVSGLAYGVDSLAHKQTLTSKGKTIAVLGSGFDHVYPSIHTNLAEEIAMCGLLVSEYSPETNANKFTFPLRNRIVAGLSDGVLITEASAKSGTIITKDIALDSGIEVYAVPGNITSDKSQGTNEIIASLQGHCVLDSNYILKELGIDKTKSKKFIQYSMDESKIIELLSSGEKDIEYLSERVDFDIKKLNSLLTTLEIKSIIKRMPGGFYALG